MILAQGEAFLIAILATPFLLAAVWGYLLFRCYYRTKTGFAIHRNGAGGAKISFTGLVAIPILHNVEYIDISIRSFNVHRAESCPVIFSSGTEGKVESSFELALIKPLMT